MSRGGAIAREGLCRSICECGTRRGKINVPAAGLDECVEEQKIDGEEAKTGKEKSAPLELKVSRGGVKVQGAVLARGWQPLAVLLYLWYGMYFAEERCGLLA